jgi:hypothetical protein
MMPKHEPPLLSTPDAIAWLRENYPTIPMSLATMGRLHAAGLGPPRRTISRRLTAYTVSGLRKWAEARVAKQVASTSQVLTSGREAA